MTPPAPPSYAEQDAFDLPEWLGESEVVWRSENDLRRSHRVVGALLAPGHDPVFCDLLAVDDAYPSPAAADPLRVRAHQVWQNGEVLVARDGDRVLLVVPGSRVPTDAAIQAIGRLARAVGARAGSWSVQLRIGS
ncbi:MAG: hypothetical protein QM747_16340 [Nocardioides sp.]